MPGIAIRSMAPADIPACAQLMASSPLWIRYQVTLASASARLATGLAENAALFVAEEDGDIAGFVWCVPRGAFDRSGYVPLIGVQPARTGHGVGTALLAYAEAYFAGGSSDVFLLVSDFNMAAQRFYRRHGYRQVGALSDYILPGVTELLFWKRLTSPAGGDPAHPADRRPIG